MADKIKRIVQLKNTTANHNKFYSLTLIERSDGAYVVRKKWGRLNGQEEYSAEQSWASAMHSIDLQKRAKLARGYVEKADRLAGRGHVFDPADPASPISELEWEQRYGEAAGVQLPSKSATSSKAEDDLPEDTIYKDDDKESKRFSDIRQKRRENAKW